MNNRIWKVMDCGKQIWIVWTGQGFFQPEKFEGFRSDGLNQWAMYDGSRDDNIYGPFDNKSDAMACDKELSEL
jgi:hypothetical protein